MDSKECVNKLKKLVDVGMTLIKNGSKGCNNGFVITSCDKGLFLRWVSDILNLITKVGCQNSIYAEQIQRYTNVNFANFEYVNDVLGQLNGVISALENGILGCNAISRENSCEQLENIFNKFARVARQLRTRHDGRETLSIRDEYDVQDLLHSLLLLHFDDVRAEEWTPSYAGGCERMDFLLKDLQTVIEVKKTRPSMSKKELGEELIVDIEKYKAHPDCKLLYCFVYDPDGYLGNSVAIKNDLEKTHEGFVKIFVKPEF